MESRWQAVRIYAAVSAGGCFGYLSPFSMPVLVGPLMEVFSIDERTVGILIGLELAGIALASISVAARAARVSLRHVALAGALVTCAGQLASIGADGLELFAAARFVTGLGEGAVMAAAFAAAADTPLPERVFAVNQVAFSVVVMTLLFLIPHLVDAWGYRAGLTSLLVAFPLIAPALLFLPVASKAPRPSEAAAPEAGFPHPKLGAAALVAYAVVNVADIGVWVFAERIGVSIDLSPERIGGILALSSLLGLVGCLAAAVLATRFGRVAPLVGGIALVAALIVGLGRASSELVYLLCLLPFAAAILFVYPYFLGTLAALDEGGSWTASSGSAGAIGMMVGPVLAGYLAAEYSYGAMSWLMGGLVMASLPVMLGVVWSLGSSGAETVRDRVGKGGAP